MVSIPTAKCQLHLTSGTPVFPGFLGEEEVGQLPSVPFSRLADAQATLGSGRLSPLEGGPTPPAAIQARSAQSRRGTTSRAWLRGGDPRVGHRKRPRQPAVFADFVKARTDSIDFSSALSSITTKLPSLSGLDHLAVLPADRREVGKLLAYGQIGLEMAAPIGLGWFLDFRLGTTPWLTVAGAILGLVGGLAHLIALLEREERRSASKGPGGPEER